VLLWWVAASVVATPLVVLVLAPGLPPGNGSVEASGQVVDNTVLLGISTPAALVVLVYFIYAIIVFREREPEAVLDGPAIRGDARVQMWWLVITTTIVLFLAGYGTVRLLADGSGGGQGPNPIASPPAPAMRSRSRWSPSSGSSTTAGRATAESRRRRWRFRPTP